MATVKAYFLETDRIGFRCWRKDDLPLAMELWGDDQVTAMIGGPHTEERVCARLEREIAQMSATGMQYWPIFLRDGDRFAGCVGLRLKTFDATHRFLDGSTKDRAMAGGARIYELGFYLIRACWGRGLALEAGRAAVDYGFAELGADAIFAGHHPKNEPSKRVLLRLGFEPAGEEFYAPNGVMEPTYLLWRR